MDIIYKGRLQDGDELGLGLKRTKRKRQETAISFSDQKDYRKLLGRNPELLYISDMLYGRIEEYSEGVSGMQVQDAFRAELYVVAPVLCLYLVWVLQSALASGKKRLYFLARDGYAMYQAAVTLCDRLQIPVECRYLHCSRYAWRSALYWLLGKEALDYVCLGGMGVTLQKICARAGLGREEAFQTAGLLHREDSLDVVLGPGELKKLRKELAGCRFFIDRMTKHSRSAYPEVCGYLEQEGLLDSASWALVDSGWTGSMQKSLRQLLLSMGYQGEVEGYYFGMYECPKDMASETYHSWYFKPQDGIFKKVFFSNSLFECLLSSEEGMTIGYCLQEGQYRPVFEKEGNPNWEKIRVSTEIIKAYAGELAESWKRKGQFFNPEEYKTAECQFGNGRAETFGASGSERSARKNKKTAFCLLKAFMAKPSLAEAEYFGSYIFCDDVIGEGNGQVAARLTPGQIKGNRFLRKAAALLGKRGGRAEESAWLEGSICLAGMGGGELRHCAIYKYILYIRKRIAGEFEDIRRKKGRVT